MKTVNANQLNMALAVQTVILRHQAVWNNYQGFASEVDAMTDQLRLVKQHQQEAEVQVKGVTQDKAHAADKAIEMGMRLGGSAYVYAKKAGNETLQKQFKLTKRSLTDVEGVVTLNRLKTLHDNIEAVIDVLGNYVTADELRTFKAAIDHFESRVSSPRDTIVGRGISNDLLEEAVRELKSIFENMDNLVTKFKDSVFEKEYTRARMVLDPGSRKEKEEGHTSEDKTAQL